MRFTYLILMTFFLLINCSFSLYLLKINLTYVNIKPFMFLLVLFFLLSFDNYTVLYKSLFLFLIYIWVWVYNFFKFNYNTVCILSILQLWIFNAVFQIKSFLNLIVLLEITNWVVIILILVTLNKKKQLKIILTFISLNIISLTLWTILYIILFQLFKTTNLDIILFCLYYDNAYLYLNYFIYIVCIIKLSAFIGPKFQVNIYNNIIDNFKVSFIYLYYSYIILPVLVTPVLFILKIPLNIICLSLLLVVVSNVYFFSNYFNKVKLVFLSSQISLLYLIIFTF